MNRELKLLGAEINRTQVFGVMVSSADVLKKFFAAHTPNDVMTIIGQDFNKRCSPAPTTYDANFHAAKVVVMMA